MKKAGQVIFAVAVFALLLLPVGGLFSAGTAFDTSNPDAFVEQNMALRSEWITLYASLSQAVFGETGNPQVVAGQDGFLYFADTLPDYYERDVAVEARVEAWARGLAALQQRLKEQGIRFVFLCAPNKNSIYPEYMPYYAVPAEGGSALRLLEARLGELGVASVNALGVLKAAKADAGEALLYHPTDTHWNARGAHTVYCALMALLEGEDTLTYTQYPDEWLWDPPILGDLTRLYLPLAPEPIVDMPEAIPRTYHVKGVMRSLSDGLIETTSDANGLRMLMLRDSFGDALFPFLANNVGELRYSRAFPPDVQQLAGGTPDVVVLEMAERNLSKLEALAPGEPEALDAGQATNGP